MYSIFNVTINSEDAEKKLKRLESTVALLEKSSNEKVSKIGSDLGSLTQSISLGKLDFGSVSSELSRIQSQISKLEDSGELSIFDSASLEVAKTDLGSLVDQIKEMSQESASVRDLIKEISESGNEQMQGVASVAEGLNMDSETIDEVLEKISAVKTEINSVTTSGKGVISEEDLELLDELNLSLVEQERGLKAARKANQGLAIQQAATHAAATVQNTQQMTMWARLSTQVGLFGARLRTLGVVGSRAIGVIAKGMRGLAAIMKANVVMLIATVVTELIKYIVSNADAVADLLVKVEDIAYEVYGMFKDWITGASEAEKAQNKLTRAVEKTNREIKRYKDDQMKGFKLFKDDDADIKKRVDALKGLQKEFGYSAEELMKMSEDEFAKIVNWEGKGGKLAEIEELEKKIAALERKREQLQKGGGMGGESSKANIEAINALINGLRVQLEQHREQFALENLEDSIKEEEELLKEQEAMRERNAEIFDKYTEERIKSTTEYDKEMEEERNRHNAKMREINADEAEYTGDLLSHGDFNKERKAEDKLYSENQKKITEKYKKYLDGITKQMNAITQTDLEQQKAEIEKQYTDALEDLDKKYGKNSDTYKKYSQTLKNVRDYKLTKADNDSELEQKKRAQEIELQGVEAIYNQEVKIAEIRGDEELAHKAEMRLINKKLQMSQDMVNVLKQQRAEYEAMGAKNDVERMNKQIDAEELKQANLSAQAFDSTLEMLQSTLDLDLDFSNIGNGIQNLKEKLTGINEVTAKIAETRKKLSEATTEEDKKMYSNELTQLEATKDSLKDDLKSKGIIAAANAFANGISTAAAKMKEFAEATGNVQLSQMADEMSAMSDIIGSAAQGAAQGGWIGAAAGAATSIITQLVDGIVSAKTEMAELERNTEDFHSALEESSILFDPTKHESIFGENRMGKIRDLLKSSKNFVDEYKKSIKELEEAGFEGKKSKRNWGAFFLDPDAIRQIFYAQDRMTNEYKTYLAGVEKGYDGLQNMLINTKDRNGFLNFIGFQDEYTSLKDLAPELWDEDGEFNVKNAEIFLDTNTQITEEQRRQLSIIVEQKKQSEEYEKQMEQMLQETFGGMADSLSDALINSVRSGEDALNSLKDTALDVMDSLERQLVSGIFNTYLSSYQDKMKAIIESGGNEEDMADLISDIWGGMRRTVEVATRAINEFEDNAMMEGFDLTEAAEDAQEAMSKGISAMTEDTASELNGNFMGLKLSAMEISHNVAAMKALSEQSNATARAGLSALAQISANTAYCRHLEEINNNIGTIMRSGVRVK